MSHRARTRTALVAAALASSLSLVAAGCGFDSSSEAAQNEQCRAATVGQTTRDSLHEALGGPTVTEHETTAGRRVVSDMYVDGTVGFSFDERSGVLVEKDC